MLKKHFIRNAKDNNNKRKRNDCKPNLTSDKTIQTEKNIKTMFYTFASNEKNK